MKLMRSYALWRASVRWFVQFAVWNFRKMRSQSMLVCVERAWNVQCLQQVTTVIVHLFELQYVNQKDMISGIEKRFFEGHGIQGKNPKYSLTDLDNENFRTIGEIIAVSLAQGGPAPAFLKEWCYTFLCRGEMDINCLSKEDVADLESSLLISRMGRLIMQLVKSQSLEVQHVLQWMTGQGHIPILPDEKRNFKIIFKFDHKCRERLGDHSICYPVVSACTSTVTFPVQHLNTYSEFRSIMGEAVRYGGGFHRV
nr:uncharacterized protein LOC111850974 isoform X2 [Paramormyrops kingsleyae]